MICSATSITVRPSHLAVDPMKPLFALLLAALSISSARASDSRFLSSLKRLDPGTRLEQICDLYAMQQIAHDSNPFHPDRAKSDVISRPRHAGATISGKGGAFRSGGRWYQYSFKCTASGDRTKVLSFSYQLGKEIPESKWATYGLWR